MKKQIILFLILVLSVAGCYAQPTTDQKSDYFTIKKVPAVNNSADEVLVRNITTGRIEKTNRQNLFSQDNVFLVKSAILPDNTPSNADILSTINTLPAYVVSDTNNVIFSLFYRSQESIGYLLKFILVNSGKGTYGFANTQCTLNDIELVYSGKASQQDILELPNTQTFNYGNISGTISNWVNSHTAITVQNQGDGYVIINANISGTDRSWLFTAAGGKYGIGFNQTTDNDFQLFGSILDSATPDLSGYQLINRLQQNMNSSANNYPSIDAVRTALGDKQDNLPNQTGNNGKVLGTNGSALSWVANSSSTPTLQEVTDVGSITTNPITISEPSNILVSTLSNDNFSIADFANQLHSSMSFNYIDVLDAFNGKRSTLFADRLELSSNGLGATLQVKSDLLTSQRVLQAPNASGTIALTSDIPTTATDIDALKRDGSNANTDVNIGAYSLIATKVGIGTSTPSVALDVVGLFKVEKGIDDGIGNYSTLQTNNYGLYFKGRNGSDDSNFGSSLLISNPEEGFTSLIKNADNTDYSNIINHNDKIELGITTNDTKGSIESKVTDTNIPEFTIVTQKSNLFKIESSTAGSIQYNLRNNDDTYWSVTNNDPNSFNRTIYNGDESITSLESHNAFNWTIGRDAIPLLDVDTRNLKVTIGDVTNIANDTKIIINDVTQDVTVNAITFSTSGDFTSAGTISSANIDATNNIYGVALTGNSIQSYGSIVANAIVVGTNVSPTNLTDIAAKVSKGVDNATTIVLSSATLNSTYPTVTTGFKVYCTSIIAGAMTYEKTPTGWIGYTVFVP